MRTKKEIRGTYRDQNSRNRIEDKLIQSAINEIEVLGDRGYDVKLDEKTIVDMAFDMQEEQKISAAAAALGRRGGLKGGHSTSPAKKSASAANLDAARAAGKVGGWKKGVPRKKKTEGEN